jgi:hypothetical protein
LPSADPLKEIDIGDKITPRLTFVKNISLEHKYVIIKLLKCMLIASPVIIMKCPDSAKSW